MNVFLRWWLRCLITICGWAFYAILKVIWWDSWKRSGHQHRGEIMKAIIITLIVVVGIGAGLWKVSSDRRAEVLAKNEAIRQERDAAVRNERLEFFGAAGLDPAITWTDSGLGYIIYAEGTGARPIPGSEVTFNYIVKLKDGREVDRTKDPIEARIGQMIPGVSAGLQKIQVGGRALLFIPPKLGYGSREYGSIPPDSGLLFEVALVD